MFFLQDYACLPEDEGLAVPVLEPPSEFRDNGFVSRLEVIFSDPMELPALVFPLWATILPEFAFCIVPVGFLVLAAELFRFLLEPSASASAMQAPGWGGNGGKSLAGAGGGSWEESCPPMWE